MQEREEIARGLCLGESLRAIAERLARAPSTVSREVASGGGRSAYRVWRAEERAELLARRPKVPKLVRDGELRHLVESKLKRRWSAQQISAHLQHVFATEPQMRVSHETIYQSLFVQSRGALRRELSACVRTGRARGISHNRTRKMTRGHMTDMVLITDRPVEVADRAVPGHWEGDLVIGGGKTGKSAIATLVERHSRYVMLVRLPRGRTAACVRDALTRTVGQLPEHLRRSLTWDQGKEMAHHVQFAIDTDIKVFFCNPHSPWERGSNENTNGLLRQYFPKKTDFSAVARS